MSKRIHIIAACASRKRYSAAASLGNVSGSTIQVRADRWWRNLSDLGSKPEISTRPQAHQLYTGNYWSIIRQLPDEALQQALLPSLWILSAGYGLVSANYRVLPYSATFVRGDIDSVYNVDSNQNAAEEWWNELAKMDLPNSDTPRTLERLLTDFRSDQFLIIGSSDYLSAIESDLIRGRNSLRSKDKLVLISSRTRPIHESLRSNLVMTDARMLCNPTCEPGCDSHILGKGVRGSIGASLARYLLSNIHSWGFSAAQFTGHIERALIDLPPPFFPSRSTLTNSEIKNFIKSAMVTDGNVSATRLLRSLRDAGKACEQKRFKQLYCEVNRQTNEIKT